MEFVETPLQHAVDYLKDLHGIEIGLDERALDDVGIGTDLPVTGSFKRTSLGSALRLLLGRFELTYVVRDGVMLISTPAAVRKMIDLRVYDVHDLVSQQADVSDVTIILQLALDPQRPIDERAAGATRPADETRAACAPSSEIMPFGNLLVVRASIPEQEAIAGLLDEMRQKLRSAEN
jgi:hypothetical protein